MNLALDLPHLAVGKLWNHFDLLLNRVHGAGDLLLSTAGGGGSISVGALQAIHHALGHLLAVHQRYTDVSLSGDHVSDAEYALHVGVARHILAGECVVFARHVDAGKSL